MGIFDRSSSTTVVDDRTDARQVGQENISGVGVGQTGGNVTVNVTDRGAVEEGVALARDAIYAGAQGLEELTTFGRDVLSFGADQNLETAATLRDTTDRAFAFGDRVVGEALESSRAGQEQVIGFAGDVVANYLDEGGALLDRVVTAVQDSGRSFVGAVNDTFARESTNTDARLENITKYVLIGGGLVVAVALYSALSK
jgi:hypothetical protein